MPTPTIIFGFSPTTPSAGNGRRNAKPATDSGSPLAKFSFGFANFGTTRAISSGPDTITQSDQGKLLIYSVGSAFAVTINNPTDAEFKVFVMNNGAGTATFTPSSGQINGGASLALATGQNGIIFWDGTNWWTALMGGPGSSVLIEVNGTPTSNQAVLNVTGGTGVSVSNPSGGTVQISVSGTGPTPSSRRWAYVNVGVNTPTGSGTFIGDQSFSFGSTVTWQGPFGSPSFLAPVGIYTTSGSSNSDAGMNGTTAWGTGSNILWQARVALHLLTSVRFRVGVGDASSDSAWLGSDTLTTINYAAFRFSSSASDTNFQCETGDGAAVAVADSGVAVSVDTLYLLQIKFQDATPNIVFSINGTAVATATTHLPAASKALRHWEGIRTLTTAARTFYMVWTYLESDD